MNKDKTVEELLLEAQEDGDPDETPDESVKEPAEGAAPEAGREAAKSEDPDKAAEAERLAMLERQNRGLLKEVSKLRAKGRAGATQEEPEEVKKARFEDAFTDDPGQAMLDLQKEAVETAKREVLKQQENGPLFSEEESASYTVEAICTSYNVAPDQGKQTLEEAMNYLDDICNAPGMDAIADEVENIKANSHNVYKDLYDYTVQLWWANPANQKAAMENAAAQAKAPSERDVKKEEIKNQLRGMQPTRGAASVADLGGAPKVAPRITELPKRERLKLTVEQLIEAASADE